MIKLHCMNATDVVRYEMIFAGNPQALADEILEQNCGDLALLSPTAFHYFVSAYMLYSLNHPDSEVASFTFMQFGRSGFDAIDLERFRLFNRQQKEAVIAYLGFLSHTKLKVMNKIIVTIRTILIMSSSFGRS